MRPHLLTADEQRRYNGDVDARRVAIHAAVKRAGLAFDVELLAASMGVVSAMN